VFRFGSMKSTEADPTASLGYHLVLSERLAHQCPAAGEYGYFYLHFGISPAWIRLSSSSMVSYTVARWCDRHSIRRQDR
jgi:hypothetical protein